MELPRSGRWICGLVLGSALSAGAAGQAVYWEVSPFMTLVEPRDWKMTVRLQVDNFEDQNLIPGYKEHPTKMMDAEGGSVFFPVVPATSFSQISLNQVKGSLRLNDTTVTDKPEVFVNRGDEKPLPAGTFLAEFKFEEFPQMHEMQMQLTTIGRSWEVIYDQDKAAEVGWPKELPPVLQTLFEPEMFIDRGPYGPYDLSRVKALVNEWTEGDPKSVPPAVAAKWIATKVAETYRISGRGYSGPVGESTNNQPVSALGSLTVDGPEYAALMERGSRFNLPVLLVACYRAAGIPARLVIGYDFDETRSYADGPTGEHVRAWVEFALYDERVKDEKQRLTWVPVDIVRLQENAIWTHPFEQEEEYFGTSDEWDKLIPMAFHFTPYWVPGVSYGRYLFEDDETWEYYRSRVQKDRRASLFAPALWSWNVRPAPPAWAGQWLDLLKDSPMNTEVEPLPPQVRKGNPPRR